MVNAEVQKPGNESPLSVIRKFSRRVQGTGLIQNARKRRYFSRATSKTVVKKKALKKIARRTAFNQLVKEGKVVERERHGHRQPATMSAATQTKESSTGKFGEDTPIAR